MIRTTTKLSAKELESVLSIWLHANLILMNSFHQLIGRIK